MFYLGGLTYSLDCGPTHLHCEVSVRHKASDQFNFWVTGDVRETVHSSTVSFAALDTQVFEIVQGFRRSLLTPVFSMEGARRSQPS